MTGTHTIRDASKAAYGRGAYLGTGREAFAAGWSTMPDLRTVAL